MYLLKTDHSHPNTINIYEYIKKEPTGVILVSLITSPRLILRSGYGHAFTAQLHVCAL